MVEKSSEKRIAIQEICSSRWFMKNYQKNLSIPDNGQKVNQNSTSELNIPPEKLKSYQNSSSDLNLSPAKLFRKDQESKLSWFKKSMVSNQSRSCQFDGEEDQNNEGSINKQSYQIVTKFMEGSSNDIYEISSIQNYNYSNVLDSMKKIEHNNDSIFLLRVY